MHQAVRNGLEDYLAGKRMESGEFESHLSVCNECSAEVEELQRQTRLFKALRTEPMEPAPGFYARVLDRIEQRVKPSIWAVMLQPSFGRRIAVASAALTLILGGYLVSTESEFRMHQHPAVVSSDSTQVASRSDSDASTQDRDAVLVSLASFQDN